MTSRSVVNFAAPALVGALLLGMTALDDLSLDPHKADAYHARVAAAVARIPRSIGAWQFRSDAPLLADAQEMLRPNAYLDRSYYRYTSAAGGAARLQLAQLMVVQCRDVRHMVGHYPPVCYPGLGCKLPRAQRQAWRAGSLQVTGTEYEVVWPDGSRRIIRNFFVLPNGKLVPDMESVTLAAKNYREVVYGVAQVQLLLDASTSAAERDDAFAALIGANAALIDVLRTGGFD